MKVSSPPRPSAPSALPLHRVFPSGREMEFVREVLQSGHWHGAGRFTERCERFLQEHLGAPRVLLTSSGTAALEMAACLSGVGPGDEVLMPSFTFPSTANAFLMRGAKPVFVDIRPDTLNLNEELLGARATPRTRAVVPVHYAGVGVEMAAVRDLAQQRGWTVVEDAAQGLGAQWRGAPLGTWGDLAAFSFHGTKNVTCGEGGALVLNDARWKERAEILREKGTDRARFVQGLTDKYTWVDEGSSWVPSEITAAVLWAQLLVLDEVTRRRRERFERYLQAFQPWEERGWVRLPGVPPHSRPNGHIFYLVLPDPAARERLIAHLAARRIGASFHYVPLHRSPMGARLGYRPGDLPVTESLAARLVRLPIYPDLSEEEQARVIAAVEDFFRPARR